MFLLRQFGFGDEFRGDQLSVALDSLSDNPSDDDIVDLHAHLFPREQERVRDTEDSRRRWEPGFVRLFISHITADRAVMSELKEALVRWGVDGFLAHQDIEPTTDWLSEIEAALGSCDALLAYLTPQFHQSKYVDHEIGFCVARRVLIIPVQADVVPYGFIARYQSLRDDGVGARALATKIAETLATHASTAGLMADRLVAALAASRSFDGTREIMHVIEDVTAWTPEQLTGLEEAIKKNNQVGDAVISGTSTRAFRPVPEAIREIVDRFSR